MDDDTFFFEEVEIGEDLDEGMNNYEEVPEDLSGDSDDSDQELRKAIDSMKNGVSAQSPSTQSEPPTITAPVVDDFFRNFLLHNQFHATLTTFQDEYYERQQKNPGKTIDIGLIPDVYRENQYLGKQLDQSRQDLEKAKQQAHLARSTWDKLKKERDFHRLHHRRVVQEKNKLANDMKRLRKHYSSFEPTIKLLKDKYENIMKEKMMMKIERDRLLAQIETLKIQVNSLEKGDVEREDGDPIEKDKGNIGLSVNNDTPYPPDRFNVQQLATTESTDPPNVHKFTLQKTFSGHTMAISCVANHPHKPIVATVSDDRSWKLWSIPNGDLIMSGEGHRDWIASCSFHPVGGLLATASGDGTVKIWDLINPACRSTFSDHSQAVWGCAFHSTGDFLISCSIDHSSKLWDIHSERCRHTFRGHVDSVNSIAFQSWSNSFATGSGDKTVSLWDIRSGLCVQTFFGHGNAVNHVAFNLSGELIVSSDADGIVKVWDIRAVREKIQISCSNHGTSVNQSIFDRTGTVIVSANDDHSVRIASIVDGSELGVLAGHDGSVQSIAFDSTGSTLISGASDNTFRLWSL
uniref:Uncharacterized protein n=2 Tax=Spongospora subterranea TaxID=70186 RepID=A0A0H5QV91_9EUKA|eukprot:CRZ05908.1 hypothetical protein [Spongospora subterranea]